MPENCQITAAEILLPTQDLSNDLPFYVDKLGFRLDTIFPADNPSVAVLSGYGLRLRLEKGANSAPGTLRLLCNNPEELKAKLNCSVAPNGTKIVIVEANPPLHMPQTQHSFVVKRLKDNAPWVIGRAGMNYRDLIPDRLGGSIIASHIRIPGGGLVPDMVHYHTVGFQLIYCYRGWVKVLYEDQGEEITLRAGDCVNQPPQIRHRVLEASADIEVIEIGVPAEHITTIDHQLKLPTKNIDRQRQWDGQKFCHHLVNEAEWKPWRMAGFDVRDTGMSRATNGVAGVQIARHNSTPTSLSSHNTDILFTFVMEGTMTLEGEGEKPVPLASGDAFVIPPDMKTAYRDCSEDLELLEVSLKGEFETTQFKD